MAIATFPVPFVGVPVRVELRATVQPNGTVLWSADGIIEPDAPGFVGNGPTPAAACDELSRVLAFHAERGTDSKGEQS